MKIKTKKQFTLPQLIEWAMVNNVDNTIFIGKKNLYNVGFNKNGLMYFNTTKPIPTGEIFTVEVEEEITEDMEFKELICLDIDNNYYSYDNVSVSDFHEDRVKAIYIPNDDLTITLIWTQEKGLVE